MNWYGLHVRSNHESMVVEKLRYAGIEGFYPFRLARSKDGRRDVEVKFMPGYVFAYFDIEDKTPVVGIPQVAAILGFGSHAVAIPDYQIEAVRKVSMSPTAEPHAFVTCGQLVRVKYGPLTGVEGLVIALPKNKFKLVVSIEMMGRSCSSEIDAASCEPIHPAIPQAA